MGELKVLKKEPLAEKANGDVVQFLEISLKRARAGEIDGVLIVEHEHSGDVIYSTTGIENRWEVIGYLNLFIHNLLKRSME